MQFIRQRVPSMVPTRQLRRTRRVEVWKLTNRYIGTRELIHDGSLAATDKTDAISHVKASLGIKEEECRGGRYAKYLFRAY